MENAEELEQEARRLLRDPAIAEKIMASFRTVNESDTIFYILLCVLEKQSVELRGASSSGKNTIADEACAYLPPHWWLKVSGLSDKALRYLQNELRLLYISERKAITNGKNDNEETNQQLDIKLMISEGVLRIPVTVKDPKSPLGFVTKYRDVRIGSFLTTTTTETSQGEFENRFHILNTREGEEQNRRVVKSILDEAESLPWEVSDNFAMRLTVQTALEIIEREAPQYVVIPYASAMEEGFDLSREHIRRNVKKLRALINASARLHFLQRPIVIGHNGERVVVASVEDLRLVLRIGGRALESTFNVMSQSAIETLGICNEIFERGEDITVKGVFSELEKRKAIAEPTVYKRLQALCHKGYLRQNKIDEAEEEETAKAERGRKRVVYALVARSTIQSLARLLDPGSLEKYEERIRRFWLRNFCTPNLQFERPPENNSSNLAPFVKRSSNQGDPESGSFEKEHGSTKIHFEKEESDYDKSENHPKGYCSVCQTAYGRLLQEHLRFSHPEEVSK